MPKWVMGFEEEEQKATIRSGIKVAVGPRPYHMLYLDVY